MEDQNDDFKPLTEFPRSWEDIPSSTVYASRHYQVAEVLVEEGMEIEPGTDFILDILKEEEEEEPPKSSTRSTQSYTSQSLQSKAVSHDESAPANKKHKVNDNGHTKQKTITIHCSCLVAGVMVTKGIKVKPSEPLYAVKFPDPQALSKDAYEKKLLTLKKKLEEIRERHPLPAMTD